MQYPPYSTATGSGERLAARLCVTAGVTPTVPRLAYSLVVLDAAEAGAGAGPGAGAGAGRGDDPSGVTPPGEFPAGKALQGEVTPGEAC